MVSEKVVTVIPKKENLTESGKKPVTRVAAYVRVSSASDAQEESFDSQVAHFEEYIGNHPGWEMVKIYQDEGISGMNIKKRKGFKQMLADGKRGRFDKVLVKSISRWGRNTVDSLEAIRMLQDCNIGAVFEKEALDTSQPGSEFILTIMASLAQAESMSISQNVQIGYQYKMARGEHTLAYSQFLGYDKGEDGKLVVNPEQAKTVKLIYTEFLKGLSLQDVSKKLMAEGHLTGKGNSVWGKSALSRIIRNEKYAGMALLGKTVTVNVLEKKRKRNEGEGQQYFVENDHEPIVDMQTWLIAQGELARRDEGTMGKVPGPKIESERNDFTALIRCPVCGANYNHKRSKKIVVWSCFNRLNGDCKAPNIKETVVQDTVLRAAQKLHDMQPEIKLHKVPKLKRTDSRERKIEVAAVYMDNVFASRVAGFLKGKRPEKYTDSIPKQLIERIEPSDGNWTVRFYGGFSVEVEQEFVKPEVGRRLSRV